MAADDSCSEEHLAMIAALITDWRAVSPFLGLTEAEEIAILESTHSVPARKMAMLRKWKKKKGSAATYDQLSRVFRKCGLVDLEEQVTQMMTESSATYSTSYVPLQASVNRPSADRTGVSTVVCSQPPAMADLMSQVAGKTPTKWYEVGIQLNIDTSTLDAFEQQTRDHMRLYSKVFSQWKKEQNLPYTWDTIINVLETIGEKETVIAIRKWLKEKASSGSPHSAASSSKAPAADAMPTLLKLNTMKGADGKPLNIIQVISAKDYVTFGMSLLQDENGTTVDLIKKDHIHDGAKSVTRAIFQRWLASTVAPRTYQHLIDCLNVTDELDGLAELIEKALTNSA